MKKFYFWLLLSCCFTWATAQINSSENFNAGTSIPSGWVQDNGTDGSSSFGAVTSTQACEGNSYRDNIYGTTGQRIGRLTSPSLGTGIGDPVDVSFDYKVVEWSAATTPTPASEFSIVVSYSTDGGSTWNVGYTIDASNHTESSTCANVSFSTPAVAAGADFRLRFTGTNLTTGDFFMYLDNIEALSFNPTADADGDGFTADVDCNDNDASINPGATDIPDDGIDQDCDGEDASADNDGDGVTVADGDCNDNDATIYPGATDIPGNGIDEDCNGADAPVNDNCSGATSLIVNGAAVDGTVLGATADAEPNDCGSNGPGVWYSFVVPDSGSVSIETGADSAETTGFDSVIEAFSGSCGALTSIDCDDDGAETGNYSLLELEGLTAGSTVYVRVWEYGGNETEPFSIWVTAADAPVDADGDGYNADEDCDDSNADINPGATDIPGNGIDEDCSGADAIFGATCEYAIEVTSLPYTTTDDTANYGDDYSGTPGAEGCGTTFSYLNGDDVVYVYTAASDGEINISMTPTATYSGIFVYTSCDNIGVACEAGVGNGGTSVREINNFNVVAGQSYYIVISTWPSPQSTGYDLSITEAVFDADDDGYSVADGDCDDDDATINPGATDIPDDGIDQDCDGEDASADNDGDGYTIADGDCNDDDATINPGAEDIPGNGIDEDCSGADAPLPPANDECANAEMLADGVTAEGTVLGATDSGIAANTCDGYTGTADDDVFYYFMATTAEGSVVLADNFDGVVELWEGADCGSLVFVTCKDTGTDPTIEFTDLTAGGMYYVRVFSYGSTTPSNPTFTLTYTSVSTVVDTDGDGVADDEDNCPEIANADQADMDEDGQGDACDDDIDGDGVANDDDCDPMDPEVGEGMMYYADADGDGFGDAEMGMVMCEMTAGYVMDNTDCNDGDATIYPGAEEVANDGIDQDCDGEDLIVIEECPAPTGIEVNVVNRRNVTFNDVDGEPGDMYDIESSANPGFTPTGNPQFVGVAMPFTVPFALADNWTYEFYARKHCGEMMSDWAGSFQFTVSPGTTVIMSPNPAVARVNVTGIDLTQVAIYDGHGRLVAKFNTTSNEFNVSKLQSGVYTVHLIGAEGQVSVQKLIKK